jgi:virginiamycin B lyase
VLLALLPATVFADPAISGEFALPNQPFHLALGPDGNVWVAIGGGNPDFSKVSPSGVVTSFDAAGVSSPNGMTVGPDGNMWTTQSGGVVKFSTANPAAAQAFSIAGLIDPRQIVTGPDGNLWTASGSDVYRISPSNPSGSFTAFPVAGLSARGITSGGDGNLWVADFSGRVIKVTPAGVATPVTTGGGVQEVAAGPGTQIAYTNPGGIPESMGRIDPGGLPQVTPFVTPPDPSGIVFARDGAYWTAQFATDNVGRLAPDGSYTKLDKFTAASGPRFITEGAGDTLWVALETSQKIGRITGVVAPPPAFVDATAPVITGVSVLPKSFAVGKKQTALAAKKTPVGTNFKFTLSEAASVELKMEKRLPGKRHGVACVKPRRELNSKKNCVRYRTAGVLNRISAIGANTVPFSGRIGKRALSPGRYRLSVTATDAAGNASAVATTTFGVLAVQPAH